MRQKTTRLQTKDYETLGKLLESIIENGYIDRRRMYRMSFLKGVMGGLGGVVGATIVVAVIAWLLSVVGNIPFLGDIADTVRDTLQSSD